MSNFSSDSKMNESKTYTTIRQQKRQKNMWTFILLFPLMSGLIIFYIYPFIQNFIYSFTDLGAFGQWDWVGIANYQRLFQDAQVGQAFINTFLITLVSVPITIILALLIAVLLNSKIKGKGFYRVLYFLPAVTMPAAIAMIWRWLFNGQYGLVNQFLNVIGIENVSWLTNPDFSRSALIIVTIWSGIAIKIIFFLGGLQTIPNSLYEAAEIDGASSFKKFTHITVPMLAPTIFFVSITTLIQNLQMFDVVFMLIPRFGNGFVTTRTVIFEFYQHAFEFMDKGYASAISIIIFLVILLITIIQLRLQKKWVTYL